MTATALQSKPAASAVEAGLTHIYPVRLAKPFIGGWRQVPALTPNGYWTHYRLDNYTGGVVLQMGSLSDRPPSPKIGWTWTGWKKPYVYARAGESFFVTARTRAVTVRPNGGVTVPRVFISLHPQGGGGPIESSVVVRSNRTHVVAVTAPRNGYYTLHTSFNIRSVRSGGAYPYCEILGTLDPVIHMVRQFALGATFAGAVDEELPEDVAQLLQPEEREFADEELAEQLALIDAEPGIEIPAGAAAFDEPK